VVIDGILTAGDGFWPERNAGEFGAVRFAVGRGCEPVVVDLDRGWEQGDPGRDRAMCPYTDADTAAVMDGAVKALVVVRAPMWLGDPGPILSVLVSLGAEVSGRVEDGVADARDHGYSWDQIASRLAIGSCTARRRYSGYVAWRNGQPSMVVEAPVGVDERGGGSGGGGEL
jgi:hypothetical protein